MTEQQDAPTRTFGALYTLAVWAGFALTVAILAWLLWTVFGNTPTGTVQSQELLVVRPTQTALAAMFQGAEPGEGGVVVVDLPATCAACHAIQGTSAAGQVCPDLTNIGAVAEQRLASAAYQASDGSATTVEEFIRESILEPSVYCLAEEDNYCTPTGLSTMPAAVGEALTPRELDQLVTYLASLQ